MDGQDIKKLKELLHDVGKAGWLVRDGLEEKLMDHVERHEQQMFEETGTPYTCGLRKILPVFEMIKKHEFLGSEIAFDQD